MSSSLQCSRQRICDDDAVANPYCFYDHVQQKDPMADIEQKKMKNNGIKEYYSSSTTPFPLLLSSFKCQNQEESDNFSQVSEVLYLITITTFYSFFFSKWSVVLVLGFIIYFCCHATAT